MKSGVQPSYTLHLNVDSSKSLSRPESFKFIII